MLSMVWIAAIAGGCPGPARGPCTNQFVGDPSLPVEAKLLVTDGISQVQREVQPGDPVPLEPPPQGGYVLYVGVAARNLNTCSVTLAGTLRDPDTNAQLGRDGRNPDLLVGADGWARTDPSDNSHVTNVNACPDYGATDRQGQRLILRLDLTDRAGRHGSASAPVVPTCAQPNAKSQFDCICTCSANYFPGKCDPNAVDLSAVDLSVAD
jgi:hypothetical protein